MIKPTTLCLLFLFGMTCHAQRMYPTYQVQNQTDSIGNELIVKSQKFINSKLNKIKRVSKHEQRKTDQLLRKLGKKEQRYLAKLADRDSTLEQSNQTKMTFDSIANKLKSNDASAFESKTKHSMQRTLDSLRGLKQFAMNASQKANGLLQTPKLDELKQLDALESKLKQQAQAQQWIQERSEQLMKMGQVSKYTKGLKGISKQSFYYTQQLKSYKNMVNKPSLLEEKALRYLQGMKGFDAATSNPSMNVNEPNAMSHAKGVEDLERMGYQTKRQVKTHLTRQMGLQKPEQLEQLSSKFKAGKQQLNETKQTLQTSKQDLKKLGFKPNPMRGLPLRLRLEKSMNWQVLRAIDGQPAKLELNAQAGFKHTPTLTYNIVLGGALGLGKDWQHLRLSFEGLRIGANADLKMIWGISGQAGFERVYKSYTNTIVRTGEQQLAPQVLTETKQYRDIAYCGLQKSYKLNSKYIGTMLLAYDFLWKQGNASTPIIWRMGWKKK